MKKLEIKSCQQNLLIVKLIHLFNPFCIIYILKLNLPSCRMIDENYKFLDCEMPQEFYDLISG